eukprot:6273473-Ditylum_brightwellii.AAC.1
MERRGARAAHCGFNYGSEVPPNSCCSVAVVATGLFWLLFITHFIEKTTEDMNMMHLDYLEEKTDFG